MGISIVWMGCWDHAFVKTHQMVCLIKIKQKCSGPCPKLIESESVWELWYIPATEERCWSRLASFIMTDILLLKELISKYFRLCGSCELSWNDQTLRLQCTHGQYINESAWPCANKTLFKKWAAACSQPTLASDGHPISFKSISSQDYCERSWNAWKKVFQILTALPSSFLHLGSTDPGKPGLLLLWNPHHLLGLTPVTWAVPPASQCCPTSLHGTHI